LRGDSGVLQIPRYGAAEAIGKSSDGFAAAWAKGRETDFHEPEGCAVRICGQIGAKVAITTRDEVAAQEVAATFSE
jgi:hypothetical protein